MRTERPDHKLAETALRREGKRDGLPRKGHEIALRGIPITPGVAIGPLIDADAVAKAAELVGDAVGRGAKLLAGGKAIEGVGTFFEPTVITDVPDDCKIMTQEPFGPLAPVVTFKTFDEVVERANSLPFGLAAYAFTSSNSTAIWSRAWKKPIRASA